MSDRTLSLAVKETLVFDGTHCMLYGEESAAVEAVQSDEDLPYAIVLCKKGDGKVKGEAHINTGLACSEQC